MWWPPQWLSSCCLSRAPWISADMSEGRRSNSNSLLRGCMASSGGCRGSGDPGLRGHEHTCAQWRLCLESSSSRSQADDPLTAAISCLPCRVTSSRFTPPLQTPNILCVDIWDVCQRLFSLDVRAQDESAAAWLRCAQLFTQRVRCFYSNAFVRSKSHVK